MKLDAVLLKKLSRAPTWDEVKRELCDVLGEADPKERAIEGLLQYKPKDKGLGEIAGDIITKAARATDDVAMVVGVGNVPIEVKGLSKPLMLKWDGVEGQCQLMVLTTLTDVDVILGMDVLSQFDVKIDSRNQAASPERELCT